MSSTKINWIYQDNWVYLKFDIVDIFTLQEDLRASESWKAKFQERKGEKTNIISETREMVSCEPLARQVWQKTIAELRQPIAGIWVITDSKPMAAGAKIMGIFTSNSIQTVSSGEKIYSRTLPETPALEASAV